MQSKNLTTFTFILVCTFLAGGLISHFFWMTATLAFVVTFFLQGHGNRCLSNQSTNIGHIDIAIILVCISELLSCMFSIYVPNSISYTLSVFLVTSLWLFIRRFVLYERQWHYIELGMSVLALVFSIITIVSFYIYKHNLSALSDFQLTDFKREYTPLRIPINDWVTFLLCLLPYPVQCAIKATCKVDTLIFVCIMALQIVSILLSLSRGAYVALYCFYLISAISICTDRYESRKKKAGVIASTLLIAGVLTIPNLSEITQTCSMSNTISQRQSIEGRMKLIKDVPALWRKYPIVGVGGNNFNVVYDSLVNDRLSSRTRATNFYLLILLEKGGIGLSAYMFLVISVVVSGLRHIKIKHSSSLYLAAFIALCIRGFFFSSINRYEIIMSWIIMLIIGIVYEFKEEIYE